MFKMNYWVKLLRHIDQVVKFGTLDSLRVWLGRILDTMNKEVPVCPCLVPCISVLVIHNAGHPWMGEFESLI
jgi:hypothetical protein